MVSRTRDMQDNREKFNFVFISHVLLVPSPYDHRVYRVPGFLSAKGQTLWYSMYTTTCGRERRERESYDRKKAIVLYKSFNTHWAGQGYVEALHTYI
jgi:hypothetical protein